MKLKKITIFFAGKILLLQICFQKGFSELKLIVAGILKGIFIQKIL